MKYIKKMGCIGLAAIMLLPLAACAGRKLPSRGDDGMADLSDQYEKLTFPTTPSQKNSWEYIENEDVNIDWYVDVSSWPAATNNDVTKVIKEKTGITVHFMTPVSDDGQKLTTMMADGELPDVISVPTSKDLNLAQLAQKGYVYDINTLADKWAPSLYRNLPKDVLDWWAFGNGKTYGIPNHYYSYEDVPDGQLQPNGGMMVRKDLFEEWQAHIAQDERVSEGMLTYEAKDGTQKTVPAEGFITTPEGFKEAASWAIENHYGNRDREITTALQLSPNVGGTINPSFTWLSEFFAVPFEDREGNYQFAFTQPGYEEMLYFLNDLCTTKVNGNPLLSRSVFSQNYDGVGSIIAGGKAFATVATPQDFQMHFETARTNDLEYVSLYITNEAGDAPVLADIRGYGYLMNMITLDCKRPDLVIKLFDFLSSDEGQRLVCFGAEGKGWEWADTDKTTIKYTDQYLADKADKGKTVEGYGMMKFDLLINYQYYDNVQPQTNHGKSEGEIYRTNLKRPLTVYSYDYNATHFVVDATQSDFKQYTQNLTSINKDLNQQIPKIIQATTAAEAKRLYDQTVKLLQKDNLEFVLQKQQEAFKKTKEKLGLTFAWPPYMEGYVNPLDRTKPNGDVSYYRGY